MSEHINLEHEFPVLKHGYYFNHASAAPWPRCAAEAVKAFADENIHTGSDGYRAWHQREQQLRQMMAEMTGAPSADDIAFLKNTTEGICTVAYGLGWKPGDNAVIPIGEFPSNRLPWLAQKVHGVEVREVDIRSPVCAEEAIALAMDDRTRIVAVSTVQWSDGFRLDLERLGDICRERGSLFFIDAIQQLGAMPLDVEACGADFLAADAHKWLLGPEGIAVFYCRDSALPLLRLGQQGWHMFDRPFQFERNEFEPANNARRFEAGSPNTMGQVALHACAGLLMRCGLERVGQRVLENTEMLIEGLDACPDVLVNSPRAPERRSGIVCFRHQRIDTSELYRRLADAGVSCVVRGGSIRLSPHFYQGPAMMQSFLDLLARI